MKLSKKKVHELKSERKVIVVKKERTAAEDVVGRDTEEQRTEKGCKKTTQSQLGSCMYKSLG